MSERGKSTMADAPITMQDWQPGTRPIVWPSNRKLEITLGLGRRQVQNVLSALIRANLITPVDSPTGRRWGHRDAKTGKIVEAYGFDLSPIGQRHAELVAIIERTAAEERQRAALRRRLTIARKAPPSRSPRPRSSISLPTATGAT